MEDEEKLLLCQQMPRVGRLDRISGLDHEGYWAAVSLFLLAFMQVECAKIFEFRSESEQNFPFAPQLHLKSVLQLLFGRNYPSRKGEKRLGLRLVRDLENCKHLGKFLTFLCFKLWQRLN